MKAMKQIAQFFVAIVIVLTFCRTATAFYNPQMQRWINRDPIGTKGGFNLYEFVLDNPLNIVDRLGLQGFSICQRDLQETSPIDAIGNACGGEHTYVQYDGGKGDLWGWGFGGGGTAPELHFHPSSCTPCRQTGTLGAGSGKGKPTANATPCEIKDCLKNSQPTAPYRWYGYNCKSWANEAAKNCGLDCSGPYDPGGAPGRRW
jgi:hypothetical protein